MALLRDNDHIMREHISTYAQTPQTQTCKKLKLRCSHDNFISSHTQRRRQPVYLKSRVIPIRRNPKTESGNCIAQIDSDVCFIA